MTANTFLHAGEPPRKKLDQLRADIAVATKSIEELEDSPLPAADAARAVMSALTPRIDHAHSVLRSYLRPGASLPLADLELDLLLLPDLEKRLAALLVVSPSTQALSLVVRQKKIAELRAKVASIERTEEMEICALEARGFVVERRVEVPIATLISVWSDGA